MAGSAHDTSPPIIRDGVKTLNILISLFHYNTKWINNITREKKTCTKGLGSSILFIYQDEKNRHMVFSRFLFT